MMAFQMSQYLTKSRGIPTVDNTVVKRLLGICLYYHNLEASDSLRKYRECSVHFNEFVHIEFALWTREYEVRFYVS